MPIYEYACQGCCKEFEILVSSERSADSQTCPQCASEQLIRKFSAFASPSSSAQTCPAKGNSCGKFT
ncbi:MAG: zinc ribbon domain-containing protein [Candidatus Zixiibacteriota bacterium]|nr:MAG: zinc ribbon domain-containing protein [candidate division Zixibacteria bacterium]